MQTVGALDKVYAYVWMASTVRSKRCDTAKKPLVCLQSSTPCFHCLQNSMPRSHHEALSMSKRCISCKWSTECTCGDNRLVAMDRSFSGLLVCCAFSNPKIVNRDAICDQYTKHTPYQVQGRCRACRYWRDNKCILVWSGWDYIRTKHCAACSDFRRKISSK